MRVCMIVCDGKGGERQQACGSVFCRGAAACRGSAGLSKISKCSKSVHSTDSRFFFVT